MNTGLPEGRQSPRQGQAGREVKGLAPLTSHKMQMHCPDSTTGKQGEIIAPPQASPGQLLPPPLLSSSSSTSHAVVFLGMAEENFLKNWVHNLFTAELMSYFPPLSPAGIHLPGNSRGGWPSSPAGVMPQLLVWPSVDHTSNK